MDTKIVRRHSPQRRNAVAGGTRSIATLRPADEHRLVLISTRPRQRQTRLAAAPIADGQDAGPGAWTFDTDAVYSIEESLLVARSLADGEIMWQKPLSGAGMRAIGNAAWQARRVGEYLLVSPQAFGSDAQFRFRSPLGTLQWNVGPLLAPEAVYPLSCYDPKTGQLVQRLHFRMELPPRTTLEQRTSFQKRAVRCGSRERLPCRPATVGQQFGWIRLGLMSPWAARSGG